MRYALFDDSGNCRGHWIGDDGKYHEINGQSPRYLVAVEDGNEKLKPSIPAKPTLYEVIAAMGDPEKTAALKAKYKES